ncbi:maleylpyruvate isomerase family mycothiol-dependent enzyme [Jatrophihabitans sp. DSM 45814]
MVDYDEALLDQNRQLTELVDGADWSAQVPTCPGWSVLQLLRHVGRGDRWAAQIITDRAGADLDPRQVSDGRPPEDPDGAMKWLLESPRRVVDAVAEAGPETAVATFLGPRPAKWWVRRRLHEATVHRFDAALALGADYELSPELAADGIAEWLELVAARESQALSAGQTLSLRATDDGGAGVWTVSGANSGWTREPDDSGAVVSGSTAELFLALVRRRSTDEARLTVSGEAPVWDAWLAATPF